MRRGSLIAPLLIILVGTLLLVKNVRPDLPLFETMVAYWPFLLIGWGFLRLLEITWAWVRGKAFPMPGVSGGEWALIIVLTLVGSSIWGVQHIVHAPWNWSRGVNIDGWQILGNPFDYPLADRTAKAGLTPHVIIDNPRGMVRVSGSNEETVKITGRKSVRALDKDDADKAANLTPLDVLTEGSTVTIRGNQDRAADRYVAIDLEIQVPRGASLDCRGRSGDWDLSDIGGAIDVSSDRASVRVQNVNSTVRVNTRRSDLVRIIDAKSDVEVKGAGRDIELENIEGQVLINGSFSGETSMRKLAKTVRFESSVTNFHLEKVLGELHITLGNITGDNLVGPLMLDNKRAKDVRLTDVSNSIEISLDRGDIQLRQSKLPLAKTTLTTHGGDIEIALPAAAQFTLHASTERGNLSNEFSDKLKEEEQDHGGRITGVIGTGPDLKLSTNRGALTVRKILAGEVESLTPDAGKAPKAPPSRAENQ